MSSVRGPSPGRNAVENCLLHLLQWPLRRSTHQILETLNAEHFAMLIKNFDESIGLWDHPVPSAQVDFARFRRSEIHKGTKDGALGIELATFSIGNKNRWRMARSEEAHAAAALLESSGGHCEVEAVEGDVIVHEGVKTPQRLPSGVLRLSSCRVSE